MIIISIDITMTVRHAPTHCQGLKIFFFILLEFKIKVQVKEIDQEGVIIFHILLKILE